MLRAEANSSYTGSSNSNSFPYSDQYAIGAYRSAMDYSIKPKKSMGHDMMANQVINSRTRSKASGHLHVPDNFQELKVSDDDWLDAEEFNSKYAKRHQSIDTLSER